MSTVKKGDQVLYNVRNEERAQLELIGSNVNQLPATVNKVNDDGSVDLTAANKEIKWDVFGATKGNDEGNYETEAAETTGTTTETTSGSGPDNSGNGGEDNGGDNNTAAGQ